MVMAIFGPQSLALSSIGVILIYVLYWAYKLLTDPLRDIPGPRLARYTRLWLAREYARGKYEKTNIALHEKYGPIVRIAPDQYSINDASSIKIIYGHGSSFLKSDWYLPWGHPDFMNLFNLTDSKEHSMLRRKLANPYTMSSLVSYEPFVDECSSILVQKLTKFALNGERVDLGKWFQYYAFDVIGQITFSRRFGFMEQGVDVDGCIETIDGQNRYCSIVGVFPGFHPYFVRLGDLLGMTPRAVNALMDIIQRQIAICKQDIEKTDSNSILDFVKGMVRSQSESLSKITDMDIRTSASANVFAGSDTTSISLSAVIYHLCKFPKSLAKLQAELNEATQAQKISDPITWQEAQNLPYLQAVIKEGLRIHPATGFTMPRIVPSGGKAIAGRFFPQGVTVGVNAWVAHSNPAIYDEDAREFRPERWLEKDQAKLSLQESMFMSFGQGSRTCIGKNISLLELSKVIPELVRHFEFDLEMDGDWSCNNNWFVKPVDFHCRLRKRENPFQQHKSPFAAQHE